MSLSDEITLKIKNGQVVHQTHIPAEDVREAVLKLKEEIKEESLNNTKTRTINMIIDEIFGEKLTGGKGK